MEIVVRHVEEADHPGVHALLTSPHVLGGTMRMPFAPYSSTQKRLEEARGATRLVAEADGGIVGFSELITYPDAPRHAHVGEINLIVTHAAWQGRGVGRRLMEAMLDLADKWLRLERLGLVVFTDNAGAIGLYESLGFAIEGTMPRYGFGDGAWMDAHVMGRLRPGRNRSGG